ncbi:MAG: hypothetical protein LBV00_03360 [Propionibacteriaceae bacterium]|jgi:glucosamine--fructose-6-phosphate aminotransferase (isomerizing)|nr:hypothetical protein [Propionibacteriaceae bacterium]
MEGQISFLDGEIAQSTALERIAATVSDQIAGLTPLRQAPEEGVNFTGMGASYAALAVPVRLLTGNGVPAQRLLASDVPDFAGALHSGLMVAVSQSGCSTETLEAMNVVTVPRVVVVNQTGGPLTRTCEACISLGGEPDSYASTVGYTGTIIALTAIARAVLRHDWGGEWVGIGGKVSAIQAQVAPVIEALASQAAEVVGVDVVAGGMSRATAEEGALLLREVCRVPATAAVTRNYLHGGMESAGDTMHVILGDGREIALARSLADAGHQTLLVTSEEVASSGCLTVIRLPIETAPVRVVVETLVLQRLAGALAGVRGVDIEEFVFSNPDTKTSASMP